MFPLFIRRSKNLAFPELLRRGVAALILVAAFPPLQVHGNPPEPETLVLEEKLGISHPEQLVHFSIKSGPTDAAKATLRNEAGETVPFQILSDGRLVLQTGLAVGEKKVWSLVKEGASPGVKGGVVVSEKKGYYEIVNGLTGIRIAKAAPVAPRTPAPIQGLLLRDGTWTAEGPNFMDQPALAMNVEFLEKGPLLVRAKVTYRYFRKRVHGNRMPEAIPEGEGNYSQTIELQAGQPSVLFEEDSEVDLTYRINLTKGLFADQARYRGKHASSVEHGRSPDGKLYNMTSKVKDYDALVDLNPDSDRDRFTGAAFTYLSNWNPWPTDTGWYWMLYSTKGKSENIVGLFSGKGSRLLVPALSGVAVDVWRDQEGKGTRGADAEVGLLFKFARLSPTQKHSAHIRFQWAVFVGTQKADLLDPEKVQPINVQMNVHGGVDLDFIKDVPTEYPDPPSGYGNIFRKMGPSLQLEAEDARKKFDAILEFSRSYFDTLVNGVGIYDRNTHYFMGASKMYTFMLEMDRLLGSEYLSKEERAQLKAIAAVYAAVLWNHDVAPMHAEAGVNRGPHNMSSMWLSTRYAMTQFVAGNPAFTGQLEEVESATHDLFHEFISESGAGSACPWYFHTATTPLLGLIQQAQMLGLADRFLDDPRMERMAEFLLQLQTPPDVRFGGRRKILSLGHGQGQTGSAMLGQTATLLATRYPELSARLMGAWKESGNPHNMFFGDSRMKIDESLPSGPVKLGHDDFEGYMSVMRYNSDTDRETALWFVNGSGYSDHAQGDQGTVMIHALGAPLSENWGSYSFPFTSSPLMHSTAIPESLLDQPWNAEEVSLTYPSDMSGAPWGRKGNTGWPLLGFTESAKDRARFADRSDYHWERSVLSIDADPTRPVFVIDDSVTIEGDHPSEMIYCWNMMAEGEVKTPAGALTPELRTHHEKNKILEKPSAALVREMKAGLNRFQFTGRWGIDWDLYSVSPVDYKFALGNFATSWAGSEGGGQFRRAQGRPFEQRQHILWIRGDSQHRTVILPRLKTDDGAPAELSQDGETLSVKLASGTLLIAKTHYNFVGNEKTSLSTFTEAPAEGAGIRILEGPAEVIVKGNMAHLRAAGAEGPRRVVLPPGNWKSADSSLSQQKGGEWLWSHDGKSKRTIELSKE